MRLAFIGRRIGDPCATNPAAGTITQTGGLTIDGELKIQKGGTYDLDATVVDDDGSMIVNEGTLIVANGTVNGAFDNDANLTVDSGDELTLDGTATLAGAIEGAGATLSIAGGSTTFSNATVDTFGSIDVGDASATLGVDLSYGGGFDLDEGGTLDLNGKTLVLSGVTNDLADGSLDGSGTLKITGAANVGDLNFGAPETLADAGAMTQDGLLTLSDELLIEHGASYTLTDALGIKGGDYRQQRKLRRRQRRRIVADHERDH